MKHIIITLLIIINYNGLLSRSWDELLRDEVIYQYHTDMAVQLEGILSAYIEECWNDSTLQVDGGLSAILRDSVFQYHADSFYVHRKPSFEGFIEWLHSNHHKTIYPEPYKIMGRDKVDKFLKKYEEPEFLH